MHISFEPKTFWKINSLFPLAIFMYSITAIASKDHNLKLSIHFNYIIYNFQASWWDMPTRCVKCNRRAHFNDVIIFLPLKANSRVVHEALLGRLLISTHAHHIWQILVGWKLYDEIQVSHMFGLRVKTGLIKIMWFKTKNDFQDLSWHTYNVGARSFPRC